MDAEMCALPPPAGMNHTLYAALYQQAVTQLDDEAEREAVAARKPVRAIGDPYGNFSAVGLDLANNEVILQDENHFRILVYDRTANTPPTATLTEPKRIIAGDQTESRVKLRDLRRSEQRRHLYRQQRQHRHDGRLLAGAAGQCAAEPETEHAAWNVRHCGG